IISSFSSHIFYRNRSAAPFLLLFSFFNSFSSQRLLSPLRSVARSIQKNWSSELSFFGRSSISNKVNLPE
ncbi:hypothetical protein PFISCL1PPCAC_3476, partial [Pristionchus fissidentatus]